MANEERTKITLYKVYRFVEGQHEAYRGRPWGEGPPPAGLFMAADIYRRHLDDLTEELKTRYLVAGRRVIEVHAVEYEQDEGSWGVIEVHYQGRDCVLGGSYDEMVEPERIIYDLITDIENECGRAANPLRLDRIRRVAEELHVAWLANQRGELRSEPRETWKKRYERR